MKRITKKLISILLTVLMLLSVAPLGGIISFAASTVKFSISVVSETDDEVVIALSLDDGSVCAYDIQVNAVDYNSEPKTTGLTLDEVAESDNLKTFISQYTSSDDIQPVFNSQKNDGRASFASIGSYNLKGTIFTYTFSKSKSDKVKASDFMAVCNSCIDGKYNSITVLIENKIGNRYQTGDIIEFGSYPQSKVTDEETIAQLDAATKSWISYGYYSGTGELEGGGMTPSDYMKYADITLDGNKYRAVTFSKYRPYWTIGIAGTSTSETYQYSSDYYIDSIYYFKYQPLKWQVLDADTGLVVCDSAIDSQAYNNYLFLNVDSLEFYGDADKTYNAIDWEHSSLRAWLNDDFLNTAFTSAQQSEIEETTRDNKSTYATAYDSNPTSDKITLLSYWDVINANYGFNSDNMENDSARQKNVTDYAKCQGCFYQDNQNALWWLRSPNQIYLTAGVSNAGEVSTGLMDAEILFFGITNYTGNGIVPAFNFSDLSNLQSSSPDVDKTCGETLIWTFDESVGTLTIGGTGDMYDFTWGNRPWEDHIEQIKKVVINDNVTSIGDYAFSGCTELMSISIPNSVTTIGNSALYLCNNLKSIAIPNSVKEIDEYAFCLCNELTNITIPNSVINIGHGAFFNCAGLTNINVDEGNTVYDSRNNCNAIIETKTNTLIYACKNTVIPNSVVSIGDYAFGGHTGLTNITIPGSVTDIGIAAFQGCSDLTNITISDSVSNIDAYAFENTGYYDNESNWDNGVLYIGNHLIKAKDTLSGTFKIKNGTKTIATYALSGCAGLTNITIPTTVTSINDWAFYFCTKLKSIVIPKNVTSIGNGTIHGCDGLTSLKIDEGNTVYDSRNNCNAIIETATNTLIAGFKNTVIPNSVTSVGEDAFAFCTGMTSITIPKSVTKIHQGAFYECNSLSNVYYMGSEKDWNKINIDNTDDGNETLLNATIHFNYVPEHDCSLNLNHVVEAPTCKKAGCEYDICTVCDAKFNKKVLPLADHIFEDWKIIKEPSTTEEGLKERVCTVCKNVEAETIDKLTGCAHKWSHITIPSTCTVVGMEYDICTECGDVINEKTLPLAAHAWGGWTVIKESTTQEEGLKEHTCTVCGKKETETIAKLKALIDSETGIEISYSDEFDDGTQIKVEEKFDNDSFQLINDNYGETRTRIFDISTIRGDEKVQPKGEITVRIPLPEGFSVKKVFVTYVDSNNGKVTKIPCEVKDGYVVFKTNHFSHYAIVEQTSDVESVSIDNVTMDYKSSKTLTPEIIADDGAEYTVTYTSDSKNVTVDENGKIYGAKKGTANITVTVTDSNGNTVTDTCKVEVKYTWWQWLIKIVLFGWIWY